MRHARRALVSGVALLGVGFAVSRCASPTQVIVEVKTDAPCERLATGIFVGKTSAEADADDAPIVAKNGCESPGLVGTAVFLPSGADDDGFSMKIVTAVGESAEDCARGRTQNCIVERRFARYEPGETVRISVSMDQACIGKKCAANEKCEEGACRPCPECVDPPRPGEDAALSPDDGGDGGGAGDGGPDAATETGTDSGPDPCLAGGSCNGGCDASTCIIVDKTNAACPPNRPCEVRCTVKDDCSSITCANGQPCVVSCSGAAGTQYCNSVSINKNGATKLCLRCDDNQACNGTDCSGAGGPCTKVCVGDGCTSGTCMSSCTTMPTCP